MERSLRVIVAWININTRDSWGEEDGGKGGFFEVVYEYPKRIFRIRGQEGKSGACEKSLVRCGERKVRENRDTGLPLSLSLPPLALPLEGGRPFDFVPISKPRMPRVVPTLPSLNERKVGSKLFRLTETTVARFPPSLPPPSQIFAR